ncbi:tetratricopeptide repeat protein [Stakelama tenebrarum]|uniref:SPOR domain-containing protein n=1 Tax=Stakelama tenebrarum TaxID=2711215 RepID=A0A6G6Y4N6_9SPHN|nr:SPOR domain-containing protein [Sphingosinithalassobacter tenebrarum]QIG79811.1 SPOR domain-containing protein [Sphingosinithalassobacter tenebrarum]
MTPLFRATAVSFVLAAAGGALPAAAQDLPTEVVAPPSPLADELGQQVRILADDPRNLEALLTAGNLSVRLNDPVAALAFYSRAAEEAPDDPRVPAGRGSALVLLGKPGEALGLFNQAEEAGLPVSAFAADRGFAYDLLGAPALAQRDYRVALEGPHDDETVRRYALSLGITGDVDEAMAQLDPLLRRSDRAAWRARAFVQAMNGDVAGAERIADNMMPANMGGALAPYFRRLQTMSAADRAFAVHFGELSPTPARIADAELAPPLPQTAPAAAPPVQLAQAQQSPQATQSPRSDRRANRERQREAAARREREATEAAERERQAALAAQREREAEETARREREAAAAARREREAALAAQRERDAAEAARREASATRPAAQPAPAPVRSSALDDIVGNITIPASELGVAPMPGGDRPAPEPEPETTEPEASAPVEAQPAAARPDPAAEHPARHWVQVAGGADASALPFTWKRLVRQAPDLFEGRQAWTTPLRFTNRLLAGPFDSSGDAQAFVNALAAEDIDAFAWTSEAGQEITRLTIK